VQHDSEDLTNLDRKGKAPAINALSHSSPAPHRYHIAVVAYSLRCPIDITIMDGRVTGNTAPGGPTAIPPSSSVAVPLTVNTSGLVQPIFAQPSFTPSSISSAPLASPQSSVAPISLVSNSLLSTSAVSSIPTIESLFREYIYRNCRDSLFWIEVGTLPVDSR